MMREEIRQEIQREITEKFDQALGRSPGITANFGRREKGEGGAIF
jgi:hypothetical protein